MPASIPIVTSGTGQPHPLPISSFSSPQVHVFVRWSYTATLSSGYLRSKSNRISSTSDLPTSALLSPVSKPQHHQTPTPSIHTTQLTMSLFFISANSSHQDAHTSLHRQPPRVLHTLYYQQYATRRKVGAQYFLPSQLGKGMVSAYIDRVCNGKDG
jgi:hypothetical protein